MIPLDYYSVFASFDQTWYRHLIFSNEAKPPQAPTPTFWQSKLKAVVGKPWALEMSGRIIQYSNAGPLEIAQGIVMRQKTPTTARFRGVIALEVSKILAIDPGVYAVYHEPIHGDPAHANLVRFQDFPRFEGSADIVELRKLEDAFIYGAPGSRLIAELETIAAKVR